MKKIIDGLRYDTENATKVASDSNVSMVGRGDHRWFDETLYRTQKGNWFMVGSGGPRSRWSIETGNGSTEGFDIMIPVEPAGARVWLEQCGGCEDEIERYFSDSIEDA
jgi:hypothetical protein